MIVPQYWAESRVRRRESDRQVTVRRFGWSDTSQEEAQAHADERAREALERIWKGERLARRDPRVPYNGAEGVPIREEILSRHGDTVVTRNSYGALCLNTPNVLFADIDFDDDPGCWPACSVTALLILLAITCGWLAESRLAGGFLVLMALIFGYYLATLLYRFTVWIRGGYERIARRRLSKFLEQHPRWGVVLYRTPAGLRILVTHQTFEPRDPVVTEFFTALATDPIYVRMCYNQQCFRARVSPKPWRIGMSHHMKPRPGVWPVAPDRLPVRNKWIAEYELAAKDFAACRFSDTLGSGIVHPDVRAVQELHDQLSGAHTGLPIA